MKIQGTIALVTGSNRGLGRAFVETLLARGARKVYAAARDVASLGELARLPGVVPLALDVTDAAQIARAAELARDVQLVVNNAGVARHSTALGADALANARAELETNALGPLAIAQAFAPALAANGGGAVVNVLSVLSWLSLPTSVTYSASKSAAWSLTNALRTALAAQGTLVVGVHAGFIDTDMAKMIQGPKVAPEAVVAAALAAVEANQPEVLADDLSRTVKQALSGGVYLAPTPGA